MSDINSNDTILKLEETIRDLTKQLKIANGKLMGISKLKEKIAKLQESNDKMSETLDFYMIQAGSKMANDED